jgi:hypothetical protein
MRAVIVPAHPGLLCAIGMAEAPLLFTRGAALLKPLGTTKDEDIARAFAPLEAEVAREMTSAGISPDGFLLERALDLRYEGQSHELRITWRRGFAADDFHAAHERANGFRDDVRPIEIVSIHASGASIDVLPKGNISREDREPAPREAPQPIDRSLAGPLFRREDLARGHAIEGPAVVGEYSGTTWIPPGWRLSVLPSEDLPGGDMSEPHRVRARIERIPILAIALGAAALLLLDCGVSIAAMLATEVRMPGATTLRDVALTTVLGMEYRGASYGVILPIAVARGFWLGLLFGLAMQALGALAALRVTVAFDDEAAR